MTKPPKSSPPQDDYVQSAVRFPRELREEIKRAAERNGRSMNAEIIARLQDRQTEALTAELAEIKAALRKILDAVT